MASDSKGPSNTPLTSWADAVEEAEVVRAVPVIEEIAKDESLSHIAPTVETIPVDDFVRPSKKGKKGTKRNSVSTESAPVAESFQSSEGRDLPGDSSPSHIAAIVATGAAVAGAALLSKTGTSHDESGATKGGSSSGTTTPTRKLSKKEKRKNESNRRAQPRELVAATVRGHRPPVRMRRSAVPACRPGGLPPGARRVGRCGHHPHRGPARRGQ